MTAGITWVWWIKFYNLSSMISRSHDGREMYRKYKAPAFTKKQSFLYVGKDTDDLQ